MPNQTPLPVSCCSQDTNSAPPEQPAPSSDRQREAMWGWIGAFVAAGAASLCCAGPAILLALGLGGAGLGVLRVFEPYRPALIVAAVILLALALISTARRLAKGTCHAGSCGAGQARRGQLFWMGLAAVALIGLLIFPAFSPQQAPPVAAEGSPGPAKVVLGIHGMSCPDCAGAIEARLRALPGVTRAAITFNPPGGIVNYDPAKITLKRVLQAIKEAGYHPSPKQPAP